MRLTDKIENENNYCFASSNYSGDLSKYNEETEIAINKTINKLGQYEDIDEEIGLTYDVIVEVLKHGIYDREGRHHWPNLELITFGILGNEMERLVFIEEQGCDKEDLIFYPSQFKKTWSLNKEDLL